VVIVLACDALWFLPVQHYARPFSIHLSDTSRYCIETAEWIEVVFGVDRGVYPVAT